MAIWTETEVIHTSDPPTAFSIPASFQIEPLKKEENTLFINVVSENPTLFAELFLYDPQKKKGILLPGNLFLNPLGDRWYAASANLLSSEMSGAQVHFLSRIGRHIEAILDIRNLSDKVLQSLAGRHGIEIKKSNHGSQISIAGKVTKERLMGYLKDIVITAGPDPLISVQKIENIPPVVVKSGFDEFGEVLTKADEAGLKKLGKVPVLVPYLKSVDKRGIPWGSYLLSRLYINGWGVKKDYGLARKYANRSIQLGLEYGKFTLGYLAKAGIGEQKDYGRALKLYQEAGENGHASAAYEAGHFYRHGKGVDKNYGKAAKWYRLSAEKGYAEAQNKLGVMYDFGWGVPKDYAVAAKWFRLAAEQGHIDSQTRLALKYKFGEGVPKNYKESVKWYRKAAEQGDSIGQAHLGKMYESGKGVAQDYKEALKWYRLAAKQGGSLGQYNLGVMYSHGWGVSRDTQRARRLIGQACEKGLSTACSYLKKQTKLAVREDPSAAHRKAATDRIVKSVLAGRKAKQDGEFKSMRVEFFSKGIFSFSVKTDKSECRFHFYRRQNLLDDKMVNRAYDRDCNGTVEGIKLFGTRKWDYRPMTPYEQEFYDDYLPIYSAIFEAANAYKSYNPKARLSLTPDTKTISENRQLLREIIKAATQSGLKGVSRGEPILKIWVNGGVDNGGFELGFTASRGRGNRLHKCYVFTSDQKGKESFYDKNCDAIPELWTDSRGSRKISAAGNEKVVQSILLDVARFSRIANKYFPQ
ncbi:MAG: sel1 repeat family protein [Deltaproteobacteria bacterium]|nr:sel1 repeat family protein [Deltaproteobacteria bacterium]